MRNWNDILKLPERCLLNRKITKAFFRRNFDLTLTDKNVLDKQIESISWLASLNPENMNIPSFVTDDVVYEEVQVIIVNVLPENFEDHFKIAEVVQKHIPYPILLCICTPEQMVWSTCNKRIKQNDSRKRVIDRRFFSQVILIHDKSSAQHEFLNSLVFSALLKTNLQDLYNSYTNRIFALQAAALNGTFAIRTQERTLADILLLESLEHIAREVKMLGNQARKETQLSEQVQLNVQIQNKRREITLLINEITDANG